MRMIRNYHSHFTLPLLILLALTPTYPRRIKPYYEIFKINNNVGLYYNHLGRIKLSNSQYTLLTHINLTIAERRYDQLFRFYTKSLNMCANKPTQIPHNDNEYFCHQSLQTIQSRISVIKDKIETLKYMINNESIKGKTITKRGLFDSTAYILRWLFGTPSIEDVEFYKKTIDSTTFENRNVQLLMKQQISIISNTIQNFNSSIQNLRADEDNLNENIKLFNNFSNLTTNYLNDIFKRHLILEQIFSLSQISSELDDYYNTIIYSITLGIHNILHPQIITPQNLLHELNNITLREGLKWPIALTYSNIYKYEKLHQLNIVCINNILIFNIKIPLIEETHYELYEMLPFPAPLNPPNTYSYIQPSSPYILLSTNKVYYTLLQNLETCLSVDTSERICSIKHMTRTSGQPTCESTLLTSTVKRIPSSCQIHTTEPDFEMWHYIQNNEWIFTAMHPLQLTLTCSPTHIEDVELTSAGIIRLQPQCKGYTKTIVLEPSEKVTTNRSHNSTQHNIVEDDCCPKTHGNSIITPVRLTPIKITNTRTEEFKYLNHKVTQLDTLLQEQLKKPTTIHHNQWHTVLLSVTLSIVGLILIINLLRCCGLLRPTMRFLCFDKESKSVKDTCCFKVINTNINSAPVTRTQLSQILEEEFRSKSGEREFDPRSTHNFDGYRQVDPSIQRTLPYGLRRSSSRTPSVNMD